MATPLHETLGSPIHSSDQAGGLQLEFTPSFATDFGVFYGDRELDPLATPRTAGLRIGEKIAFIANTTDSKPDRPCATIQDLIDFLGIGDLDTPLAIRICETTPVSIRVETSSGRRMAFECMLSETVAQLKMKIKESEGIATDRQRVIHADQELEDGQYLAMASYDQGA